MGPRRPTPTLRCAGERTPDLPAAGVRFDSPYDPEAHYGNKRTTCWSGYKVHLTGCCGQAEAHLITHVETTAAGVPDAAMTAPIQCALAAKGLTPAERTSWMPATPRPNCSWRAPASVTA